MTPRDLRNIHTTGNSSRDVLPCKNMGLKLPWHFYLLMEKPLGCYFQVLSNTTKKHLFLCPQGDGSGLRKPKKDKHTTTNHSYHQHSSP